MYKIFKKGNDEIMSESNKKNESEIKTLSIELKVRINVYLEILKVIYDLQPSEDILKIIDTYPDLKYKRINDLYTINNHLKFFLAELLCSYITHYQKRIKIYGR